MAAVLSKMPWNKTALNPTLASTIQNIPVATGNVTLS
jgi:hypothetical protein